MSLGWIEQAKTQYSDLYFFYSDHFSVEKQDK